MSPSSATTATTAPAIRRGHSSFSCTRSSALRWRSGLLRILLLGLLVTSGATTAWSQTCLPPLLDGRPRLQDVDKTGVLWLNLLLRQHEVCWRESRDPTETRIFALGNSAIYGFPWPSELSAVGLINRKFERQGTRAHIFNLGFVFTYQTKEALILSEALRYKPDFIIYGVTFDDFGHLAPYPYAPLAAFFDANSRAISRLASDPPNTFEEPFRLYRDAQATNVRPYAVWNELRQAGTFVRLAAQQTAKALRKRMFPSLREKNPKPARQNPRYDCEEVKRSYANKYANWKDWSMLEYLAQLRTETGIEVLVVNWPVAHEPRGDCYNVRYPAAAFQDYVDWIEEEAEELGLEYLDLHRLLKRREFVDSVHPTKKGQRRVAFQLEKKVAALLSRDDLR